MADAKQRRRRREAPAKLADALGSHAASAGAQRQQALARAANLLKMRPKMASARGGGTHLGGTAGASAAVAPPAAAPPVAPQPPVRWHATGGVVGEEEAPQSARGGSTHVQSQRVGAPAASRPPRQQPAVSTHSSADGADGAAGAEGGRTSGEANAAGRLAARPAAAAGQQWAGSTDPSSYFAQARSFLQQLAASRNGLG